LTKFKFQIHKKNKRMSTLSVITDTLSKLSLDDLVKVAAFVQAKIRDEKKALLVKEGKQYLDFSDIKWHNSNRDPCMCCLFIQQNSHKKPFF
jgi:hypothetical protein